MRYKAPISQTLPESERLKKKFCSFFERKREREVGSSFQEKTRLELCESSDKSSEILATNELSAKGRIFFPLDEYKRKVINVGLKQSDANAFLGGVEAGRLISLRWL